MSTQTIDLNVKPINFTNQIPSHLQGSAEEALIRYQNFAQAPHRYNKPRLLIVTDIDHRIRLRIPERFAYVIRTGAADLRGLEFQVASILALGHISSVALIGIEDSLFSKVERNKETLARNLENYAGWEEEQSRHLVEASLDQYAVPDPIAFTYEQSQILSELFPKIRATPFMYTTRQRKLALIEEHDSDEHAPVTSYRSPHLLGPEGASN